MTTTWILGLDASTPRCVLALGHVAADGRSELVAVDDELDLANQASARLATRIAELLARAGIEARQIGVVGCGRGPGTFTGTRVALATAKGLASGLGCPLLPVSTLAALAWTVDATAGAPTILATLDARRGEVYGALLRCDPAATHETWLAPEGVLTMEELARAVAAQGRPDAVIGRGAAAYPDAIPADWPTTQVVEGPSPQGLWRASVAAYQRGEAGDPSAAEAVYLRKSYAELGLNRPKRVFTKSPFV